MIELKELRINNILNYDGKPHYVSFLSLDIDDEYHEIIGVVELGKTSGEKSGWNREQNIHDKLHRIPLTSEWLERLGFTIVPAPSAYGFDCNKWNGKYILRGGWNGKAYFCLDILNNGYHKKINHVHELQNLYFTLTGEELEIK